MLEVTSVERISQQKILKLLQNVLQIASNAHKRKKLQNYGFKADNQLFNSFISQARLD